MRKCFCYALAAAIAAIGFLVPRISPADEIRQERSPSFGEPAAAPQSGSSVTLNSLYFNGYLTDFGAMLSSPSRWESSDWMTAAAVIGVTAGLYDHDASIQKWVQDHKTATTCSIGDAVTDFGHGKYTPVLVGGLYLYGVLASDAKASGTALLSLESFVLTGVFVQALKVSTGRHRPYTGDSPRTWNGFNIHNSGSAMSFPSGHASSAFAVATVIASEYETIAVVPPLAYSVAAITAVNRVAHNAHWTSDIVAGSAIGYFTGKAVAKSHRGSTLKNLSVVPILDSFMSGFSVIYTF